MENYGSDRDNRNGYIMGRKRFACWIRLHAHKNTQTSTRSRLCTQPPGMRAHTLVLRHKYVINFAFSRQQCVTVEVPCLYCCFLHTCCTQCPYIISIMGLGTGYFFHIIFLLCTLYTPHSLFHLCALYSARVLCSSHTIHVLPSTYFLYTRKIVFARYGQVIKVCSDFQ